MNLLLFEIRRKLTDAEAGSSDDMFQPSCGRGEWLQCSAVSLAESFVAPERHAND